MCVTMSEAQQLIPWTGGERPVPAGATVSIETPGEEGTDTGEQWEEAAASDPAVLSCEERTALSIESAKDCGCVFRGFLLVIVNLE